MAKRISKKSGVCLGILIKTVRSLKWQKASMSGPSRT
jgi:hypothetical protein